MIRRIAIFLVTVYVKLCYGHKVYGKSHVREGGGMIASNHSSFLDPPIIGISYPGEVHFLARGTLFNSRFFGWLIRQLNSHPVVKGKENTAAIKKTCELLLGGKKVVIFPEGKRSTDGEIQSGQSGVGMLVLRTHCMVIPAYVHGTFEIWNNQRKFPLLRGHTACVFGSPLTFEHLNGLEKKEAQQKIVELIMEAIKNLRDWYLAGATGTPP